MFHCDIKGMYVHNLRGDLVLKNQEDVVKLIQNDDRMMEIVKAASKVNLPDWWICAGFVRSKIWDTLHGFENKN